MKRAPLVVDSGQVVQLAPVVLRRPESAAFIGSSLGSLDAWRAVDVKRLSRGEPIAGPAWVKLPWGIAYRVADLQAWLDRNAVPLGVVEGKRRKKPGQDSSKAPQQ